MYSISDTSVEYWKNVPTALSLRWRNNRARYTLLAAHGHTSEFFSRSMAGVGTESVFERAAKIAELRTSRCFTSSLSPSATQCVLEHHIVARSAEMMTR